MVSQQAFKKMALSFTNTEELPHFHLLSYRYKKKIFATLWEKENKVMIRLPVNDQFVYHSLDEKTFYPVPGIWGTRGSTFVELKTVSAKLLKECLSLGYAGLQKKSK